MGSVGAAQLLEVSVVADLTTYKYSSQATSETIMNFNGSTLTSDTLVTTDGLGRPILSQVRQAPNSSNFDTTQITYGWTNGVGALTTVSTPTASAVKTQNDALGRLTTITDSGGGTTSYTYIKNDVLQSVGPTPQTFQKQFQYNGMGQLTSVCEVNSIAGSGACGQTNGENGYLTDYSYDPLGNLLSVTEGVQKRTYAHDGLSRLTSETNPESGKTQYFWDAAPSVCGSGGWSTPGDLGAKENNAGVYNCYGYDGLHRLLGVGNGGASGNCKGFYYDSANGTPPAGITLQNTKGRLVEAYTNSACNGTASLVTDEWFSYDANGRNTDLDQSTPNSGGYYHTTVSYWANNTVASLTGVPGLSSWSFTPDGEGRPYSATYNSASPLDWVTSTTYYRSNGSNPPQNIVTYGDSDTDVSSFDSTTGRMNGFQFNVGSPATTLTGTLGWSANWTLGSMAITDGFTAANSQNCGYGYDALSRISSVGCINTAGTNVWGQDFTFDAFGNLSKSVPSGDTGTSFLPTYFPLTNQYTISGCTITYDGNGNPTQDCNNTYTWSVYGNPATIGSKTLTYDAFGREAEIGSGSTYTQVLYSPIGKLGLMNGQTPKTTRYPLPGGGTAEIQGTGGTKDILHGDWLGSARLSTLYTDQTVVNDTAYSPYGETYDNTASSNLDFTGQFQDTQSGLYDFLYREYSTVGRWISPDPAGLNAVDPTNPQSWNRYAYALNNPWSFIDPTGLDCITANADGSVSEEGGDCPDVDPNNEYYIECDGCLDNATGGHFDSWSNLVLTNDDGSVAGVVGGSGGGNEGFGYTSPSDSVAANNQSFWGYLTSKPWVVSWILPVAGPVPGVVGVGPAGGVAWNPKTHNLCVGAGLGASAGHNAAIGPLTTSSGNVDSILSGWSVSGGANLPFPSPTAGLGWQVIANSSGVAQGPTAGVAGLSGAVTWSACANLW